MHPIVRRWNTLAADSLGVHLQLMPMLLGFLTYKGAVIARGRVYKSAACCSKRRLGGTLDTCFTLRLCRAPKAEVQLDTQPAVVRRCASEV